jgi:putative endopeptidase
MKVDPIALTSLACAFGAACATQRSVSPATGEQAETVSTAAVGPVRPADSSKPQIGSFGFDVAGMDRSVASGEDFFRFANGTWVRVTEIPADRSNYGLLTMLDELSEERTRKVIEDAAQAGAPAGSEAQKVGDYYLSFMDEAAIEAKGIEPLKPHLERIAAIKTRTELARALGVANRVGSNTPFGASVDQDLKDPGQYAAYLSQSGLGLPDRDYYLVDNPRFLEARTQYRSHIANMLRLAGVADPESKTQHIYALEDKIARVHWTKVEQRQVDKLYNKFKRAELARRFTGMPWPAYLDGAGLAEQRTLIVAHPSAVAGMAKLVREEPLATWKDYLTFHTLKAAARVLPKAFVEEDFAFDGRFLSGTPQLRERWKRGVQQVNLALGEAVGKLYVERHFPPDAKSKADELVRNLVAAMDERLANLEWMAPETRAKARAKLAGFLPKIGFPERWRDYSALEIVRGDAFGNAERATRFEYQRNLNKLGKPVDRTEWLMTPMTVNAYANPSMNEIVFPAAILQPPFFDPRADQAINYGGIGAVIGHEISHHFDDQGRKFDPGGRLTDWWTGADVERFKSYTDRLVAQYSQYEPLPGVKINGELTLGENIADLAGLTVAYAAYKRSLNGREAPTLDGFSGDQRFFLGWAQVWRRKYREENLRNRLVTDSHSPSPYRAAVVRNLDPWYAAFDAKPGQALYLAPEERVRIW